ncbi:DUF1496 domain-containing protein [Enterobacter ludwigii]
MLALLPLGTQADQRRHPDVQVNIPPEVFNIDEKNTAPCLQCCVYEDKNYTEGSVIKVGGILLQCKRNESTLSTNPLVWRHVKG